MLLHTILLQAADAASQTFFSKLGDQLFSIVLLVTYAIYQHNRQKQLEAKMDKYTEEDRTRMLNVIESNTRVMEGNTKVMERIESHLDKQ